MICSAISAAEYLLSSCYSVVQIRLEPQTNNANTRRPSPPQRMQICFTGFKGIKAGIARVYGQMAPMHGVSCVLKLHLVKNTLLELRRESW